jgi:uncharacterized membrane protein YuzA (DUF378 family)
MKALTWITLILVIVGGLNWGLVALFNFDLVGFLFGAMTMISKVVYVLVAISAIYILIMLPKLTK